MEVKDLQQYEIIINKHIEEVNSNEIGRASCRERVFPLV